MSQAPIIRAVLIASILCSASFAAPEPELPPLPLPPGAEQIKGYFAPQRTKIRAFEPIWVDFVVENPSEHAFEFPEGDATRFAGGRDENFWVHVSGPDGFDWPVFNYSSHAGISSLVTPYIYVSAGGRFVQRLLLNAWTDFDTPGRYTVTMRRELYSVLDGILPIDRTARSEVPLGTPEQARKVREQVECVLLSVGRLNPPVARQRVDWMLRMPMIESTFEIEILPYESDRLVQTLNDLRRCLTYSNEKAMSHTPCAEVMTYLAILRMNFSPWVDGENMVDAMVRCISEGVAPHSRITDKQRAEIFYRAVLDFGYWGVPEPWPLSARDSDPERLLQIISDGSRKGER
ncbi:MAG: hypothetical protein GC168_02285 [Candidatus Hydrogenedens sp.]|nr:hypothetical protein [Candidatus Hydrogenedens sp.]